MAQVDISTAHNEWRLQGSLDFIDDGPSAGRIEVYDGTKPPPGDAVTTQVKLFQFLLTSPPGSVMSGTADVTAAGVAMVLATGTPTWSRWVNGNGAWVQDTDVGGPASSAAVKVSAATVYAGGEVSLTSAVMG